MRSNASTTGRGDLGTILKIRRVLHGINIHPAYLVIPIVLSLVAALFEGVSVGLLIPMLNGFLQKDYSFIKELPVLGSAISQLPVSILDSDKMLFVVLVSTFIVSVLCKNIFKYSSALSMDYVALRALHHLRKVLFGRYIRFGKLYFDRTNVGHHTTVLMQLAHEALVPVLNIPKYMNALFSLVVYLVVMSMISWKLTFFALPLFAVLHFSMRSLLKSTRTYSARIVERGTALGKKSIEILSTIPLIKAYAMENSEQRHYAEISDQKVRLDFRVRILREMVLPIQEIITLLSAVFLFVAMAGLLVLEDASASPFIVYFYLVLNASQKFGGLMSFRTTLANAEGPLDEVLEVFDDENKHYVQAGDKEFVGLKRGIDFRNVVFSYQDDVGVLKDVSFSIPKGSMVAIVGPTGSGKTTIINLLMRYYDCRSDSIFIDGEDIRSFTTASLMSKIALVSQDTLLLHDTLRNNIAYGLTDITDEQLIGAVRSARLSQFIEKLPDGLNTLIGDRGVKLSGGEKQRVAIARALLKGAEVLILDEATSSLDSETEKLIQEAIDEAVQGRTAIVIAHRLSTIQHADTVIVLENGVKVEEGSFDELQKNHGLFRRLWDQQQL